MARMRVRERERRRRGRERHIHIAVYKMSINVDAAGAYIDAIQLCTKHNAMVKNICTIWTRFESLFSVNRQFRQTNTKRESPHRHAIEPCVYMIWTWTELKRTKMEYIHIQAKREDKQNFARHKNSHQHTWLHARTHDVLCVIYRTCEKKHSQHTKKVKVSAIRWHVQWILKSIPFAEVTLYGRFEFLKQCADRSMPPCEHEHWNMYLKSGNHRSIDRFDSIRKTKKYEYSLRIDNVNDQSKWKKIIII